MYRVADITTNSFSFKTGKFFNKSLDCIKIYNSDRFGDSDWYINLQDIDSGKITNLSGSKDIFKFVRKESNNIIGCMPIFFLNNSNIVCYQLCKWTDLDVKLCNLLSFCGILDRSETILKHINFSYSIDKFCFENFGSISTFLLGAFSNYPLNDIDLYIPETESIYGQLGIKDNFLYILVSDNLVYKYEFKDKKRFFGLLTKRILLDRGINKNENLVFSRSEWYRKRYNTKQNS